MEEKGDGDVYIVEVKLYVVVILAGAFVIGYAAAVVVGFHGQCPAVSVVEMNPGTYAPCEAQVAETFQFVAFNLRQRGAGIQVGLYALLCLQRQGCH